MSDVDWAKVGPGLLAVLEDLASFLSVEFVRPENVPDGENGRQYGQSRIWAVFGGEKTYLLHFGSNSYDVAICGSLQGFLHAARAAIAAAKGDAQ